MVSVIVLTANHYIFDAMTGGVASLTGLAIAYSLRRREAPLHEAAIDVRRELPLPWAA